jgi:hypothetical protein
VCVCVWCVYRAGEADEEVDAGGPDAGAGPDEEHPH